MKAAVRLSSFSKDGTDCADRRTFENPHDFQSFLGLEPHPNGFKCLARTTDKASEPCARELGREKVAKIDDEIIKFLKAGFPAPEAEDSLWRIVLSCICTVNLHHIMVATTTSTSASPVRVTQYQYLYDKWHGDLWAAYRDVYDPLASSIIADGDTATPAPPPLSSPAEVWVARATATGSTTAAGTTTTITITAERKPPLMRAFTETIGSSNRLRGLLARLPWHGAGAKRLSKREEVVGSSRGRGRIDPRPASAASDVPNRARDVVAVDSLLMREVLPDEEKVSVPESQPSFTPATPTRPRIKRNNAHARSASSPPGGSHLVPSPDSFATKASSVFSNKVGEDAVDTPMSPPDIHPVPTAQPACATCLQVQRSQRPPEFKILSPIPAAEEESPIQARVRRRPVTVRSFHHGIRKDRADDVSEEEEDEEEDSEEDSEEDDENSSEGNARLILYCRNSHQTNATCCPLVQKALQHHSNIDIPVSCGPPPSPPNLKHKEPQPPTFSLRKELASKTALRNMLGKLHAPILDCKKAQVGWLYGFTLTDPEHRKYIKIGCAEDVTTRMQYIASKCKYEPILLFQAYLPCAPEVIESMVHLHLDKYRRNMKCAAPTCDAKKTGHREWFEVELEEALDVVLKWVAFSECMPYNAAGRRCLDVYWRKKTIYAWDEMRTRRSPAVLVEEHLWPAVKRHRRFRSQEKS